MYQKERKEEERGRIKERESEKISQEIVSRNFSDLRKLLNTYSSI